MRTLTLLLAMGLHTFAADRILVHGHRGARAVLPENTMPTFEYAIGAGVDVLELDLAVTKDNVVVVSHDPYLNPTICKDVQGKVAIRNLTFAELQRYDCGARQNPLFPKQKPVPGTRIPRFDDVLALADRGNFHFNVETKIFAKWPELTPSPEDFARLVLEAVKKRGLVDRVILQSFDYRTLHAMKKLEPRMRLSALFDSASKPFVEIARDAGASIVSPKYPLVTKAEVDAAHAAGLQVVPWTANTREDWAKLVDAGVDAIISDDPAELIAYLKETSRRGR